MQVSGMPTCSILWARGESGCCDSPERPYPETGRCHTGSRRVTAEPGSLSQGMWHPGDPARPLPPAKPSPPAASPSLPGPNGGAQRPARRAPRIEPRPRCGTATAGGGPVTSAATWWLLRRSAAPPRHMPVENYRQPPGPATGPGRLAPRRPPPGPRAPRRVAPRRPCSGRATDAGPPRIPLPLSRRRGRSRYRSRRPHRRWAPPPPPAPPLPPARPPLPAPQSPEPRAGAIPSSHRGSPAATGPNRATDAGGARPYRAHAAARPLPPHRVSPRRRRRAAPGPPPVPIPVSARPRARCHRRCCRVNESLEVGGGWHRLSPPPPRSASRRLRAPQRFAPVPAPGAAGAPGAHKYACTPMHNNAHTCRSMHTHAHAAHRLVGPTQAHARKRGHVWATQAQAASDGACTRMHVFTPSSTAQHGALGMLHTVRTCTDPTLPGHGTTMAPGNGRGSWQGCVQAM